MILFSHQTDVLNKVIGLLYGFYDVIRFQVFQTSSQLIIICLIHRAILPAFTCSKSITETREQCVKFFQS